MRRGPHASMPSSGASSCGPCGPPPARHPHPPPIDPPPPRPRPPLLALPTRAPHPHPPATPTPAPRPHPCPPLLALRDATGIEPSPPRLAGSRLPGCISIDPGVASRLHVLIRHRLQLRLVVLAAVRAVHARILRPGRGGWMDGWMGGWIRIGQLGSRQAPTTPLLHGFPGLVAPIWTPVARPWPQPPLVAGNARRPATTSARLFHTRPHPSTPPVHTRPHPPA